MKTISLLKSNLFELVNVNSMQKIGSYYLVRRYNKDVIVVEYSALKEEVNKIAFEMPGGKGKGTCIWEPLNTWESVFDRDGKSNKYLAVYDELSKRFLVSKL